MELESEEQIKIILRSNLDKEVKRIILDKLYNYKYGKK